MDIMKKRFYNFDDIDSISGAGTFKNFTATKALPTEVVENEDYYITIELEDNDKIEYVSLRYYKTMNYWDILLLINNVKDMTLLPKDMDTLLNNVDISLAEHLEYFKIDDNEENENYIAAKKVEIEEELTVANERYRTFKIIRPKKITEFLKELDDYTAKLRKANI